MDDCIRNSALKIHSLILKGDFNCTTVMTVITTPYTMIRTAVSKTLGQHWLNISFLLGMLLENLKEKEILNEVVKSWYIMFFCLIWRCLRCQGSNKVVRFVWIGHPSRLRRPSVKWASRRVGRSRWHASIQTRTALTPSIPQRPCLIVPAGGDCYRGFD